MAVSRGAARALIAARRAAGLSQERLAERAGVSSRTVRALESGLAKRPHRDTLLAVGQTLGLREDALVAFVAAWRGERREVDELFTGADPVLVVQHEIARQRDILRDQAMAGLVTVGADRRWRHMTIRRRFEVISGQADTFTWMLGCDVEVVDPAALRIAAVSNVEILSITPLPAAGAVACTGRLGRTLRVGDVHEFECTYDYTGAYRPGAPHSTDDDVNLFVLQTALAQLSLEARFDAAALPARMYVSRRDSLDASPVVSSDVAINDFGIGQAHLGPLAAGVHGLEWEWPD